VISSERLEESDGRTVSGGRANFTDRTLLLSEDNTLRTVLGAKGGAMTAAVRTASQLQSERRHNVMPSVSAGRVSSSAATAAAARKTLGEMALPLALSPDCSFALNRAASSALLRSVRDPNSAEDAPCNGVP